MAKGKNEAEGTLVIERTVGLCEEGCGNKPSSKKSRFVQGHDARLKSRLYQHIRTNGDGAEVAVIEDGKRTGTSAQALLDSYGWPQPAAKRVRTRKAKAAATEDKGRLQTSRPKGKAKRTTKRKAA